MNIREEIKVIHKNGQPYGIRDKGGYLLFFPTVSKYNGQEERYKEELKEVFELAEEIKQLLDKQEQKEEPTMSAEEFVTDIKKKENNRGVSPLCYDRLIYLMKAYAAHLQSIKKVEGASAIDWCKKQGLSRLSYEGVSFITTKGKPSMLITEAMEAYAKQKQNK